MRTALVAGRLLHKPELSYTPAPNSLAICRLLIQTQPKGDRDKPHLIPVAFFGRTAEDIAQDAIKDAMIFIEARITSRERTTQNGGRFYNVELVGSSYLVGAVQPTIDPVTPPTDDVPQSFNDSFSDQLPF